MKKSIFLLTFMLCAAAISAEAQNCTSPTRCGELGYNKTKDDCTGKESLVCPFDGSKYFCASGSGMSVSDVKPGMIAYSDGSVSEDVVAGKTPVGVVAYANGASRFMIALEEQSSLKWSSVKEDLPCINNGPSTAGTLNLSNDMYGIGNTHCIMKQTGDYPAGKYCGNYKAVSSGIGSSGWYLPAAKELMMLNGYYDIINDSLKKLGKTTLSADYYWSSSESGYSSRVLYVRPSDNYVYDLDRTQALHVRCALAF